jgi:hypothetical protein
MKIKLAIIITIAVCLTGCHEEEKNIVYKIPPGPITVNEDHLLNLRHLVSPETVSFMGGEGKSPWLQVIPQIRKIAEHPYAWSNIVVKSIYQPIVTESNGVWWIKFKGKGTP